MNKNKDIEEFIGFVEEDLMEIYNLSKEDAQKMINSYGLKKLFEKHGSIAAHYSTEEYASTIFKQKSSELQKH